jgi:hypothetical protein
MTVRSTSCRSSRRSVSRIGAVFDHNPMCPGVIDAKDVVSAVIFRYPTVTAVPEADTMSMLLMTS